MRSGYFLVAVLAMALGTWLAGWWMVPLLAALWAFRERGDRALPLRAGLAGMVAWGGLIAAQWPGGATARLAEAVGATMGTGPMGLVVLTLSFAGLLAASAAALVRALAGSRRTDAAHA